MSYGFTIIESAPLSLSTFCVGLILCFGSGEAPNREQSYLKSETNRNPYKIETVPPSLGHFLARVSSVQSLIHLELIPYPDVWCM